MMKLVVTVRIDLSSCHGNEIPCSVSFYNDYLVSTVSVRVFYVVWCSLSI